MLAFVAAYFALAGWFAWTAYRLLSSIARAPDKWLPLLVGGLAAAFLAVFMFKAVIFIRRGTHAPTQVELTAAEHPRLFAFLHRLADEARAPRPHRVFLSPAVNAAVFYDLSIANLVIPSKKNLEIGLGLVNVLTLGEIKAVLAHEFGHFAQRTMAVGRWVYIAHQIAGHVVVKRDALDSALQWLSSVDLRVAWLGWILRLVVWSIRSLIDTAFGWVILAQRALGREMELQADLVAVQLTGSDALVHALHRLDAADDAMDRAMSFAAGQRRNGKQLVDLFAIQTEMLERKRAILDDPSYGMVPPLPATAPEAHRVFQSALGHPPRMWSTHPPNELREANAKRVYVAAPLDERSGWVLFEDPDAIRRRVTAQLYTSVDDAEPAQPLEPFPVENCLAKLAESFDRHFLDPRYRGAYLGRSITRSAARVADLYGPPPAPAELVRDLDALYPPSLSEAIERMDELGEEKVMLTAIERGVLETPNKLVRYRGREHRRRELPGLLAHVDQELAQARRAVEEHDRRVRTVHLAAARALSPAWEAYLRGLLAVVHYADHREADLEDAMGSLQNVVAVVTADQKVTESEIHRVVAEAQDVWSTLDAIYEEARAVELGSTLAAELDVASWAEGLGAFELPTPAPEYMGDWLGAAGEYAAGTTSALSALRAFALNELLRVEQLVADHARSGEPAPEPPDAPRLPATYPVRLPGQERPRQTKLGWWDRFQVADGLLPGAARFVVAGAIVGSVLWAARSVGSANVMIVNGLARTVVVELDGRSLTIAPHGIRDVVVDSGESYGITTRTDDGRTIESFTADVDQDFGHYAYDIAGAALLVEVRPRLNTQEVLGAPRWVSTDATQIVGDDTRYVSRDTSVVLVSPNGMHPMDLLGMATSDEERDAMVLAHVTWDLPRAPFLAAWFGLADDTPELGALIDARAENPDDVLAQTLQQDRRPRDVCARRRQSAASSPEDARQQYLAARCIDDPAARSRAYEELALKFPDDPWFGLAVSRRALARGDLDTALAQLERARDHLPELRDVIALELARVLRLRNERVNDDLAGDSPHLRYYLAIEEGRAFEGDGRSVEAWRTLYRGKIEEALAAARGLPVEAGVTIYAAASDGAPRELATRALALPLAEVNRDLALYAAALALREGVDPKPYLEILEAEPSTRPAAAFLRALATRGAGAEALAEGLDPRFHASLLLAGAIVLGDKAPATWRTIAQERLFLAERPYLRDS